MSHLESDVQLIDLVKSGDQAAFDRLYCLHQNRVRAIVGRYVRDRDEAEDLIQVVFMKVFQGLHRFRGESAFTTWLTRIALNVGLSHLRSKRSRQNGMKKERRRILTQGIRTLPKVQQKALWLRYIKDLSYREIVRELNVPLGTVKIWLYRGRHQLKRELERQGTLAM